MHLDENQIQRVLHDELSPQTGVAVRDHLADCVGCRERVNKAKDEEQIVYAMLAHLDRPTPRIGVRTIAARSRAGRSISLRVAATLLLAAGLAGVAYAIPGSPLRQWIETIGRSPAEPSRRTSIERSSEQASQRVTGPAGIAVAPGAGLVIRFVSPQRGGYVDVSLVDGSEVLVRAPSGAATFTSDAAELVIDNAASPAAFEIRIPRDAARIEIQVGQHVIFFKDRTTVRAAQPADSRGTHRIPLDPIL
jgi:hypothetical protein